jgi:hypothetical protein
MITGGSSQAAERPSMLASRLAAAGRSLLALILWGVPGVGSFTTEVWAGWMNRPGVASSLAWELTVAGCLIAARKAW